MTNFIQCCHCERSEAISLIMGHQYYIYILTNSHHTVLYTGVTNDLVRRIHEHRSKATPGFTRRYNLDKLVFYEVTEDVTSAIAREKQIKAGSRQKKVDLITTMNPQWRDLAEEL
jgi:putative endonuclease